MLGYYDWWTISLSYAIAALSGFAAFESVRHARSSQRTTLWILASGLVLGLGIWSMHFVGMLAWVPPFPLYYSVSRTLVSMVASIIASIVAMSLAIGPKRPSKIRLALGSIFVATGICCMHYIGMSAVRFSLPEMWMTSWLIASCVIALAASLTALLLLHWSSRADFDMRHQVAGALVIGLAICGMHYSGMQAMMLEPGTVSLYFPGDASGATLARIGVGNALIFTFLLLVVSYQDRLRLLNLAHDAQINAQEATRVAGQLSAAGRIAASVAHEVNNPLEAVTNLIYLAELSEISPDAASYLQQAQAELRRVAEITTHTLKFYRQPQAAAPASLPELVESVLVLFGKELQRRRITVGKRWSPELPDVECRAGEIRQVIANLVENAMDVMPRGGMLAVSMETKGEFVEVIVTDTGDGIPGEVREKLFEPFFTTKGVGGTGLGLSISAEILERHGGILKFDTRTEAPNQGTTFRILLPIRAAERLNPNAIA
ncbi:MHYT domain-containing protein [Granulicella cerasi]|uniref:histidine kinase n=1 Tax=Granulicella cerasi TaxID=741063 RepID=A0ABW1ZB04_9BACT|nr:MHYT domain-containing protein [Granulicella cerasi]